MPNSRYLQQRHELVTPATRKGRPEWIVSRGLCHYRLFSLVDIPLTRRDSVLQLKIKQWSPFADYGHYNVWQAGQVQVWIWDNQRLQLLLTEQGLKKVQIMPESVLRTRPSESLAIQLLECLEGMEGQIWQEGILVGSHWWHRLPNPTEWEHFQRAHSLPAQAILPARLQAPLLERPWGRHRHLGSHRFVYQEPLWLFLGAAIFTVIFSWQSVSLVKIAQATYQVQTMIDELSNQITPILTAKTQALADQQQIKQLLSLSASPSQLELIAQVAEKLPKEAKLMAWTYQSGALSFTIETLQLDPTFYVKTFQAVPWFKEVNVETGSGPKANKVIMRMRIDGSE